MIDGSGRTVAALGICSSRSPNSLSTKCRFEPRWLNNRTVFTFGNKDSFDRAGKCYHWTYGSNNSPKVAVSEMESTEVQIHRYCPYFSGTLYLNVSGGILPLVPTCVHKYVYFLLIATLIKHACYF